MARRTSEHADRAKQFSPFNPLKGFREALAEKERVIVPRVELTDDQVELLNRKLCRLRPNDMVTVVYFSRGEYLRLTGMVSRLDPGEGTLCIVKTRIKFEDIYDLEGDMPEDAEQPFSP